MKAGRYIAIEGPIGVGKSTLAGRLARDLNAGLLDEAPDENPFLGDFYDNPAAHALSAQLFFLLQRARQVDSLRQSDLFGGGCVADFMFDKDPLFARLTLSGPELALYEDIYARLAWQAPQPDCVIYLDASIDTLMSRIAKRGRPAEANLERDYLARVVAAYREHFATYSATPIVRVDADALDLVGNADDYQAVLSALERPESVQSLPPML
ncbi:deoxynucleoside kinase [Salinisphaera hydrothermalis]|uniref:DNA polymerase III subunit epsilon n=1 Tax=Salinisphaera hydrothermalis (strain C41B8) TaxID=1304275 RepID=A0A084ILT9_SALHC|nr:deoxynucleoside kinase [Salinisphaera hydrothermalis]KEZ77673.1 DNA polymerase III subunit epsilon [Salinisphaera hydrothermalis C41B8]